MGCVTLVLVGAGEVMPESWPGVGVRVVVLVVLGGLLLRWSRRAEWTRAHVLLVAGAVLVIRAVLAFAVAPGISFAAARYVSSAVVLVAVLALLAWAWVRTRRDERFA